MSRPPLPVELASAGASRPEVTGPAAAAPLEWSDWLNVADVITGEITDPNTIKNGDLSQDGDYMVIPVSDSATHVNGSACLAIPFAWPAALLLDGTQRVGIEVHVELEALPGAQWRVAFGVLEAADPLVCAIGVGENSGGSVVPWAIRYGASNTGNANSATNVPSIGRINVDKAAWSGTNATNLSACCSVSDGTTSQAISVDTTGISALAANARLCLFVGHQGAGVDAGDLSVRVRYALVDLDTLQPI